MKKLVLRLGLLATLGSTPILLNSHFFKKATFKNIDKNSIKYLEDNNINFINRQKIPYSRIENIKKDIALVEYYSKVFEVNSDVIVKKIQLITNNFENNWQNNFKNINNINDNKELTILLLVKDIVGNPSTYKLTKQQIVGEQYEPIECPEDITLKYSKLLGIDPKIPLSITYSECSWKLNSRMYRKDNNPAGAGGFSYANIEIGIIKHVLNLKLNYSRYDLNSSNFFAQAQKKYCPDNDGSWIKHNLNYYNNLEKNYYKYKEDREGKVLVKK